MSDDDTIMEALWEADDRMSSDERSDASTTILLDSENHSDTSEWDSDFDDDFTIEAGVMLGLDSEQDIDISQFMNE